MARYRALDHVPTSPGEEHSSTYSWALETSYALHPLTTSILNTKIAFYRLD